MIKIDFSFETQYGTFSDALHFPEDAVPDDATVEAMKQERLNNWLSLVAPQATEEAPQE